MAETQKDRIENTTRAEGQNVCNSRLVEKLCGDLKPNFLLADDGNLQNKKVWKKAMQTYTGYLRDEMEITPKLYYDLFSNLCDSDMQKKLDSIKGISTMGEKKIWEEIENIFLQTNPIIIRRVKAYETQIEKGEGVGDFFNCLTNIFSEAEMEKATPGTMLICKLIASLPSVGNEGRVKEQLLEQFMETPNPKEDELTKFSTVIKLARSTNL